jgi:hypothetical protein
VAPGEEGDIRDAHEAGDQADRAVERRDDSGIVLFQEGAQEPASNEVPRQPAAKKDGKSMLVGGQR